MLSFVKRTCEQCNGIFYDRNRYDRTVRFCSQQCYGKSIEKNVGELNPFFGKTHTEIVRKAIRERSKGKHYSKETEFQKGMKPWNYKKDRSSLKKDDRRNDPAYQEWRRQVYLRDGFECKMSNSDCSGKIEAHHILGWSEYAELRYNLNNGITLCHAHHPRKRAEEKRLVPVFQGLMSVSK